MFLHGFLLRSYFVLMFANIPLNTTFICYCTECCALLSFPARPLCAQRPSAICSTCAPPAPSRETSELGCHCTVYALHLLFHIASDLLHTPFYTPPLTSLPLPPLRSYVNEEGRIVADPNILSDLLFGAPTTRRDLKVLVAFRFMRLPVLYKWCAFGCVCSLCSAHTFSYFSVISCHDEI